LEYFYGEHEPKPCEKGLKFIFNRSNE